MNRISKSKLKPRLLKLFRDVERTGEGLIVTDHGKPVLMIIPYHEAADKELKELAGTVIKYENPTEPIGTDDWDMLV